MADQLTSDELRQVLAEWLRPMRPKHRQKILGLAGLFEAVIARAEVLDVAFANSHQLNESLGDENRALLARAEAAEAEARDARNDLDDAELHLRRAEAAATALAARVTELESQLAAQWRPVTEKPVEPPDGETSEYLTWNDFVGFTVRRYHDGQFHSAFRKQPTHWRPLPPAPQETTQ